jgi:antitoxin CptB
MKELDVVMSRYLEQHYESATMDDRRHFESMLELPDPELYDLLLGRDEKADPEFMRIAKFLRNLSRLNN